MRVLIQHVPLAVLAPNNMEHIPCVATYLIVAQPKHSCVLTPNAISVKKVAVAMAIAVQGCGCHNTTHAAALTTLALQFLACRERTVLQHRAVVHWGDPSHTYSSSHYQPYTKVEPSIEGDPPPDVPCRDEARWRWSLLEKCHLTSQPAVLMTCTTG